MNESNVLALAIRRFLGDYLPHQRAFSAHTIRSYRDSLKLLLHFAAGPKRRIADLTVADLIPVKIIAFLDHLEQHRGSDAATRNVRLSAIHRFFDYLGAEWPEHLDQARRVLAITFKRTAHRTFHVATTPLAFAFRLKLLAMTVEWSCQKKGESTSRHIQAQEGERIRTGGIHVELE